MKNNILEYIILYVIIACVALIIATLARMSAVLMGFDGFTAFMVFIIVFANQYIKKIESEEKRITFEKI